MANRYKFKHGTTKSSIDLSTKNGTTFKGSETYEAAEFFGSTEAADVDDAIDSNYRVNEDIIYAVPKRTLQVILPAADSKVGVASVKVWLNGIADAFTFTSDGYVKINSDQNLSAGRTFEWKAYAASGIEVDSGEGTLLDGSKIIENFNVADVVITVTSAYGSPSPGNVTVKQGATYTADNSTQTITFSWANGGSASIKVNDPNPTGDDYYTYYYTFAGWSSSSGTITEPITITADFNQNIRWWSISKYPYAKIDGDNATVRTSSLFDMQITENHSSSHASNTYIYKCTELPAGHQYRKILTIMGIDCPYCLHSISGDPQHQTVSFNAEVFYFDLSSNTAYYRADFQTIYITYIGITDKVIYTSNPATGYYPCNACGLTWNSNFNLSHAKSYYMNILSSITLTVWGTGGYESKTYSTSEFTIQSSQFIILNNKTISIGEYHTTWVLAYSTNQSPAVYLHHSGPGYIQICLNWKDGSKSYSNTPSHTMNYPSVSNTNVAVFGSYQWTRGSSKDCQVSSHYVSYN